MLSAEVIETAVRHAFVEDAPWGDLTTDALFERSERVVGELVARRPGVMSGGAVVRVAFGSSTDARVDCRVVDGHRFESGQVLAEIEMDVRELLRRERVGLNFLQRMCGVATLTRQFVEAVAHTKTLIVDTRKTTPGLRPFEKHAVVSGGGVNHRFSLSDAVLIKDNHLAHLVAQGVEVADVLRRVRRNIPFPSHIEVEVDRLDQIEPMLSSGVVDSLLIDNFEPDLARRAVEIVSGRVLVNASGGISTPEQAARMAETGIDLLSVGALTHSAPVIDIGLDMKVM